MVLGAALAAQSTLEPAGEFCFAGEQRLKRQSVVSDLHALRASQGPGSRYSQGARPHTIESARRHQQL